MLLNLNIGLFICGEGFASVQAQHVRVCWSPAVVFTVTKMLLFGPTAADLCLFAACSLLSVWCGRAFTVTLKKPAIKKEIHQTKTQNSMQK